jgi:hypothetical protein
MTNKKENILYLQYNYVEILWSKFFNSFINRHNHNSTILIIVIYFIENNKNPLAYKINSEHIKITC